jgi:NAD(P)-dependent dehydrogenase (short-subunit alcohol dehydrogenase family)
MKPSVLITGASYGVGEQAAYQFAKEGYQVAITATKLSNLDKTKEGLKNLGVAAFCCELNLRSQESILQTLQKVTTEFGGLDVLVNNAGENIRKLAVDVSREDWDSIMSTNLTGTFFMSQSFGKYLIEHKLPGSIIQVASVHGMVGAKERSTYGISKAAILHMTKMLAIEWAEHQIRVNAVAPGRLETDSPSRAMTGNNPEYMANMLKKIPLHRLATAQEVAQAIYYLASPAANAITGQTIVLDGGIVAG